jgi:membrane-associated phospholipid phosphatase
MYTIGKSKSFLLLNQFHPNWLDQFFIRFTFLGDGISAMVIVVWWFFIVKKRKVALAVLIAFLTSGIVAQIIKKLVVAPRPASFFSDNEYQFFLHDITHTANNSFPSGHATTAFAVITVLVFHAKKVYQLPLFVLACLISYSRVYLAQHFLLDITVGAIIGFLFALLAIKLVEPINENKLFAKRG